jgi:hypothetical protein
MERRLISQEQMNKVHTVVKAGCDLETAAGYAECETMDLANTLVELKQFANSVRLAGVTVELHHMANILKAANASDGRFWRASVWWLERRAPERFARRPAGAITPTQLKQAIFTLNEMMLEKLDSPADQQRINDSLTEIIGSIEFLIDAQSASAVLKRTERLRLSQDASRDARVTDTSQTTSPNQSDQP